MTSLEATSRWGTLPLALVLAAVAAVRLGVVGEGAAPRGVARHALLRGAVLFVAATVLAVRVLGHAGLLGRWPVLAVLALATGALSFVRRDVPTWSVVKALGARVVTRDTALFVLVAAVTVLVACASAYLLPVWQWDALGYHLPYVDFALQSGSLADVPKDMPYLATYPHVVEDVYLAWRAMLPDDRLVDLAQIPFGLLGSVAIATLAREHGAERDHAALAGLAWLTLPAVFLQLPTNYIDVATAALLLSAMALALAPPTPANVLTAGVALGLFLGSKPNAPVATCLVGAVLAVRAWRAQQRRPLALVPVALLVLGAEAYVTNIVRHHNPIWPVRVTLGPITLPGLLPMQALLDSGCAAPRLHGFVLWRVLRSWIAFDAPPIFDMRFGGLETVFLVALPVAVYLAWQRRSLVLAVMAAAALASPDPAVPRYVLAFPGLVLAIAASGLPRLAPWPRRLLLAGLAIGAAAAVIRARPGLEGEGPPLAEYLGKSESARLRAVGADGSPAAYYDALDRLAPGDVTAFDASLELPYLAFRPDLATKARWVGDDRSPEAAARVLADPAVRLLVVDDRSALAAAARADGRFEEVHHEKPRPPPKCLDLAASTSDKATALVQSLTETSSCVIFFRR